MAVAPVLGLAMIVEIRLIQWHRFAALWRYALGFLAGAVLSGLATGVTIALSVLRGWDAGLPVADWQFEVTYWTVYVGVISVLSLPVTQLWLVVFVDFSPLVLLLLLQNRHLKRVNLRLLKEFRQLVDEHKEMRRELQIDVAERILRNPAGIFASEGGKIRVDITDTAVLTGRRVLMEMADQTLTLEKRIRQRRKAYRRQEQKALKRLSSGPKRAAQALRRYQNVGL